MRALQANHRCGWSSSDFVVLYLPTTPTVSAVLRRRSPYCSVPSRPIRRRRRGVDMSPITEADVDFCRRRPPLMTTAPRIFPKLHFDWTNLLTGSQSFRLYYAVQFIVLPKYKTHLSCGLKFYFIGSLLQKSPISAKTSACFTPVFHSRDVTCHVWLVMHVVSRFLRIFMRAEKQACKQLQCNKTKLLEPGSINGLHNSRV